MTIYLDYAATTPLDPGVLKTMLPYMSAEYGNPSSLHGSGRRAGRAIEETRKKVAGVINALPEEIIFTGSGTESDNLAILGVSRANKAKGNHLIISAIEHKAVLESVNQLKKEGFEVSLLPVNSEGVVDIKKCLELVRDETLLVSVMYANNEIGTIQPIRELSEAIKKKRGRSSFPLFHTDACQAAGYLSLDVCELGVDMMTLNGSKIYGPKGIGILYKRTGVKLEPLIVGGGQEYNLRAGTENISLVVGFGEALLLAEKMKIAESERLTALREYFISRLFEEIPNIVLNGARKERLPNNVHVSISHVEGEAILLMLDEQGIEVSTGSACSANDLKASHVLLAIGQTDELAHGSIRFSFGRDTTKEKLDEALKVLPSVVNKLETISATTVNI